MFQWFLNSLERRGRKLTIYDRDNLIPYLERWYVAYPDSTKRERQDIPFNTFIHRFMRSDDPIFHSHPWTWYHSVILKNGYWEHTPWGTKWYGAGSMRYVDCRKMRHLDDDPSRPLVPANLHHAEVIKPGETWTLFSRGRTKNNGFWGFMPNMETGEIIFHKDYLEQQRKDKAHDWDPEAALIRVAGPEGVEALRARLNALAKFYDTPEKLQKLKDEIGYDKDGKVG